MEFGWKGASWHSRNADGEQAHSFAFQSMSILWPVTVMKRHALYVLHCMVQCMVQCHLGRHNITQNSQLCSVPKVPLFLFFRL